MTVVAAKGLAETRNGHDVVRSESRVRPKVWKQRRLEVSWYRNQAGNRMIACVEKE